MANINSLPLNFIGNDELFYNLKDSYLNSTLSHSIIIYGEQGIGKSTFVNYFVQQIFNNFTKNNNEIKKSKHNPLIINNSHPNYVVISQLYDDKIKKLKNYIVVDQIRSLEPFIYQSSIYDLPKIILIDSADNLNNSSSNALLKILEEPKKNTFFFLISHQLSLLLPTIRSRCIKFKFHKPNIEEFKTIILLHKENIADHELEFLYDLSNGSPGLSLEFNYLNMLEIFNKITSICRNNQILSNEIIDLSTEINSNNNKEFSSFLVILKFILSNIAKIHLGINLNIKLNLDISKKIYDLSNYLNFISCFNALNYINNYEQNLYVYNLDKKIFTINLFSELSKY